MLTSGMMNLSRGASYTNFVSVPQNVEVESDGEESGVL